MTRYFWGLCLALVTFPALAGDETYPEPNTLPADIRAFIEPGTKPLNYTKADLNGDGREDTILILEKGNTTNTNADDELPEGQRPLLILIRQPDNSLKLVKRNEKVVYCSKCGGVFGDPFQSVTAELKTFTVSAYGGSNWRWSHDYKFNYSRKDDTWQLVRISQSSYHTSVPDEVKNEEFTPPKHFGKIDIADFDPENWKDKGQK